MQTCRGLARMGWQEQPHRIWKGRAASGGAGGPREATAHWGCPLASERRPTNDIPVTPALMTMTWKGLNGREGLNGWGGGGGIGSAILSSTSECS